MYALHVGNRTGRGLPRDDPPSAQHNWPFLFQRQKRERRRLSQMPSTSHEPFQSERARRYLNTAERRFIKALASTDIETRLFCLILMWSGAPNSLELDAEVVSIETLGRRRRGGLGQASGGAVGD